MPAAAPAAAASEAPLATAPASPVLNLVEALGSTPGQVSQQAIDFALSASASLSHPYGSFAVGSAPSLGERLRRLVPIPFPDLGEFNPTSECTRIEGVYLEPPGKKAFPARLCNPETGVLEYVYVSPAPSSRHATLPGRLSRFSRFFRTPAHACA